MGIYGYQNLSGEKCKTNRKRISSIRHTSEEKNPKNHPKIPYFRKVVFFGWIKKTQKTNKVVEHGLEHRYFYTHESQKA